MASSILAFIAPDLATARAAVAAQASLRQRARLEGIFGAAAPERAVVRLLTELQNPDGGFPGGEESEAPSSAAATCRILAELKEMPPLAGSPMASRAVSFLRRNQRPGGFWGQGEGCPDLTAWAAYTIYTLDPTHQDPLSRAARYLKRFIQDEPGLSARGLACAWALWVGLWGEASPEARRGFRLLEQRSLNGQELASWLICALEVGAGGPYLLPLAQRVAELAAQQEPDGLWPAGEPWLGENPGAGRLESTLKALRVFSLCGLIQEGNNQRGEGGG